MVSLGASGRGLACCHGFAVAAGDTFVGSVETPLFAAAAAAPDHLIIRCSDAVSGTFRVVPASLVGSLDPTTRLITLAADRDAIAALPERLPLARR